MDSATPGFTQMALVKLNGSRNKPYRNGSGKWTGGVKEGLNGKEGDEKGYRRLG